jgi:hypothetical protein
MVFDRITRPFSRLKSDEAIWKIPPHFYALSAFITIMRRTGVSLRRKQREVVLREAPRYLSNVIEYDESIRANVHAE